MKRIVSMILAGTLLLCCFGTAAERMLSREEIPLAETDAKGLQRLYLMYGTENGLELERPVTRAEAVVMVTRIGGLIPADMMSRESPFMDIQGHWAEHWIVNLYRKGLIHGVTDTAFEPERTVTGQEFCKMLLSVLGQEVSDLTQVYQKGKEVGLLENNFTRSVVYHNEIMLRSDVARLCHSALLAKTASGEMLYHSLVDRGLYKTEDFHGVLFCGVPAPKAQ